MRFVLRWSLSGLLMPLLCLGGCYRYFRLPEAPAEPVEVWFTHAAFHKGIALPTGDGGHEEWGMGEWRWYAQEANSWYDPPRAMLWPSMAAPPRGFGGPR